MENTGNVHEHVHIMDTTPENSESLSDTENSTSCSLTQSHTLTSDSKTDSASTAIFNEDTTTHVNISLISGLYPNLKTVGSNNNLPGPALTSHSDSESVPANNNVPAPASTTYSESDSNDHFSDAVQGSEFSGSVHSLEQKISAPVILEEELNDSQTIEDYPGRQNTHEVPTTSMNDQNILDFIKVVDRGGVSKIPLPIRMRNYIENVESDDTMNEPREDNIEVQPRSPSDLLVFSLVNPNMPLLESNSNDLITGHSIPDSDDSLGATNLSSSISREQGSIEIRSMLTSSPEDAVDSTSQPTDVSDHEVEEDNIPLKSAEGMRTIREVHGTRIQRIESSELVKSSLPTIEEHVQTCGSSPGQSMIPSAPSLTDFISSEVPNEPIKLENPSEVSEVSKEPSEPEKRITKKAKIEEEDEVTPSKKLSKFSKLKNRIQKKISNKSVNIKKTAGGSKMALTVKRKPPTPKSATSRTQAVANVVVPTTSAPGTNPPYMYSRGSIKREVERMKQKMRLDEELRRKNSSSNTASQDCIRTASSQKLAVASQDSMSQTIFVDSSKNLKMTERGSSNLNQTKANNLITRYKMQMKKFKTHQSELTDLQKKAGKVHATLEALKSEIISQGAKLPEALPDLLWKTDDSKDVSNSSLSKADSAGTANLSKSPSAQSLTVNNLKSENTNLKRELSSLRLKIEALTLNYTELTMIRSEKDGAVDTLKTEVSKQKKLVEVHRKKIEDTLKCSQEMRVKFEDEKSQLRKKIETLEGEIKTLRIKLRAEEGKKECIQGKLADSNAEKTKLIESKKSMEESLANLQNTLNASKKELQSVHDMKAEYEKMKADFEEMKLSLHTSTLKMVGLEDVIKQNAEQLDSKKKEYDELSCKYLDGLMANQNTMDQWKKEKSRRIQLYQTIGEVASMLDVDVDPKKLTDAADKEGCEDSSAMQKVIEDIKSMIEDHEQDVRAQKQQFHELQNKHKEKQALIEQLYEFLNETNASICRKTIENCTNESNEEKITVETRENEETNNKDMAKLQSVYSLVEIRRQRLLKMESQMRILQDVHAHCGMRRTLQEARIAELETILAHCME